MRMKKTALGCVLLILGLIAIVISLSGVLKKSLYPRTETILQSQLDYREPPSIFGSEFDYQYGDKQIETELQFVVDHPQVVEAKESFIVTATLRIIDARCYARRVRLSGITKVPSKKSREEQLKEAEKLFRSIDSSTPLAGAGLAIAGADIAPDQIQPISPVNSVSWSVRPHSGGVYKGFVFGKWMHEGGDDRAAWHSNFDDNVYFTVDAIDKTFTLKTCILWFVQFLGPVLTVSGILQLWKSYREAKRKKEEMKPKIIIP